VVIRSVGLIHLKSTQLILTMGREGHTYTNAHTSTDETVRLLDK